MNVLDRARKELQKRLIQRAAAVHKADVFYELSVDQIATMLGAVDPKILSLAADFPGLTWSMLDVRNLYLEGFPDNDPDSSPEERRLNELVLATGQADAMIDLKKFRQVYDIELYAQDMVSDFRASTWILVKYRPRDPVAEITRRLAEYIALGIIAAELEVPQEIVEIVGQDFMDQTLAAHGAVDPEGDWIGEYLQVHSPAVRQFDSSEDPDHEFLEFALACGNLHQLAELIWGTKLTLVS